MVVNAADFPVDDAVVSKEYPMIFVVGEHAADYDVLLQLTYDACVGYWPVISWIVFGSLFVNRIY